MGATMLQAGDRLANLLRSLPDGVAYALQFVHRALFVPGGDKLGRLVRFQAQVAEGLRQSIVYFGCDALALL